MKIKNRRWLIRFLLLGWAIVPFFYWQEFYDHFYTYLTGTIITGIIKSQWHLVLFFIILFMLFVIPLTYRKRAKWLEYGLVGAFFVSLFIEMYGIPLTILFASKYLFIPGVTLPPNLVEFNFLNVGVGMDHAMVYGSVLMIAGAGLIIIGWWSLYRQAKKQSFADSGVYALSRHPQYLGFLMLIIGWFIGWPTILTIIFSPILIYKYIQAAGKEEKYMMNQFGEQYLNYSKNTPFFL